MNLARIISSYNNPSGLRPATRWLIAGTMAIIVLSGPLLHPSSPISLRAGESFGPTFAAEDYRPNSNYTENRHLTESQCHEYFPGLYYEADRARAFYERKGGIKLKDVDRAEEQGNARIVIKNNILYIKVYKGGINTRTQAALAALQSTLLTSIEPLPDVEFVIQTSDAGSGNSPLFTLSRKAEEKELWLLPDFGFYSWPEPGMSSWGEVRDRTLERELGLAAEAVAMDESVSLIGHDGSPQSWLAKKPKLMWRGAPMVEVRHDLLRASENKPWSDVAELNWGALKQDTEEDKIRYGGDIKTPAEHCDYRFLAQVEGYAYSGRLKYLQMCRSVVVAHPMRWIQHYHHLFNTDPTSPDQNMVEVKLPFEDNLDDTMQALLADPARSELIADNSWRMFRDGYISPAANECYYRHAIRAYASQQKFEPTIGDSASYASFMLTGQVHWDPHR